MSSTLNVNRYLSNKKSEMLTNYCPISYDSYNDTYTVNDDAAEDTNVNDEYNNLSKKYYKSVKKGNNYMNTLLNIEKKYFQEKYGSKIYDYLINERNRYIDEKIDISPVSSSSSGNIDVVKFYEREIKDLNSINELYNNTLVVDKTSDIYKRKIYYRTNELTNISYVNAISNIIYYFLLVCILILLFARNQLNLNNKYKAYLYIFVLVFPFIYHYIFDVLVYLYKKINDLFTKKIPKHAFKNNLKFYDEDFYDEDKQ